MGDAALHIKYCFKEAIALHNRFPNIRDAAVAGLFYPGQADRLAREVRALLDAADWHSGPVPKAMIVPHAGYVYSGPVAAEAYRLLAPAHERIHRVVLFGPAHRLYLDGMAVPSVDGFATPLGTVPVDGAARDEILALPGVCVSDAAHRDEHSLEVQLPFLQTLLATFTVLPVVIGRSEPTLVADALDALWGGPETLIVISSDLSHYLPYDEAQAVDANTSRKILARATTLAGTEACGANAINGLMSSAHGRQLDIEAVDVRNSGDTAGDRGRVVGYGAFILH